MHDFRFFPGMFTNVYELCLKLRWLSPLIPKGIPQRHTSESPSTSSETFKYDELLGFREDAQIEFKALQNTGNPIRLIKKYVTKYVSAFANVRGGHLLLGIEDDGRIKGIPLDNTEKKKICSVIESSIKRIHPSIDEESYLVESIPVEIEPKIRGSKQNRYVIVVSVFAGASRPYLPYSNCGHYFTRVGASVVTNPIADSSV